MDQKLNSFSTQLIEGLTAFCKIHFNECLHAKKGHNIIYIKDIDKALFGSYFSTCNEIMDLIDAGLSREESISKIVFIVDCSKFNNYDKKDIGEMSYHMAFFLFGVISNLKFRDEFKVEDASDDFINKL